MVDEAEGSSPASVMASKQDTTGVWERGTQLKGQLGNLRGPAVSMHNAGGTPGEQSPRRRVGLSHTDERRQKAGMVSQRQRQVKCCEKSGWQS